MWAAGCILYNLAALTLPFDAADLGQLMPKIMQGVFQPVPRYCVMHNLEMAFRLHLVLCSSISMALKHMAMFLFVSIFFNYCSHYSQLLTDLIHVL